jgi:hypothetical protein
LVAAARVAAVRPLTSVYVEDLHLLPCEIDDFIESVIIWTEHTYGPDEIIAAREEFFWKNGKVFEDDGFYNERMTLFLDYFIFVRPVSFLQKDGAIKTPFQAYCETPQPGEQHERMRGTVTGARYSLFEIGKTSEKSMIVFDLLNDKRHEIASRANQAFKILSRKDIFQGFLYQTPNQDAISLGTFFHDKETWSIMKKTLKRLKKAKALDESRFLAALAKIHLKSLRLKHVSPKRIYEELTEELK